LAAYPSRNLPTDFVEEAQIITPNA
jgi:hypothetical protein